MSLSDFENELRRKAPCEVRFDMAAKALYATDASNYRHVPLAVAFPKSAEDIVALLGPPKKTTAVNTMIAPIPSPQ